MVRRRRYTAKPIAAFGYTFRSRLECRIASLFKCLGVSFIYEPRSFKVEKNLHYLPDFLCELNGEQFWLEVKPGKPSRLEERKASGLARVTKQPVLLTMSCPYYDKTMEATVYWREGGDVYKDSGRLIDFLRINQYQYDAALHLSRGYFHEAQTDEIRAKLAAIHKSR